MAGLTTDQVESANARGEERLRGPRASSTHGHAGRDRVIVRLTTRVKTGFAPRHAEELQHATREDLAEIEVEALGLGIHRRVKAHGFRSDILSHTPAESGLPRHSTTTATRVLLILLRLSSKISSREAN